MSEISQNLEEVLFEAAVEKSSAAERTAFLDGVCRDNPALRARLEILLEGHFGGAGFLSQTPRRVEPTVRGGTPRAEDAPAPVIGRYKLLEKIGEGGMGEVWMAEQSQPVRRRVAFKLIKVGMDNRSAVARFEAEGQALALMDHLNIARVYDAGATAAGRPYLVMELVRGVKITEYCDRNKLSTRDRLDLFIQVCQAVQHAHQKGIIHRDLKPSNILVTVNDGVAVPKVIDFGIAKAVAQKLTDKTLFTEFQALVGTPAYMSPEQADLSSLDIDTRSDIYSLGVLLYELLVGRTPFDTAEMMRGGLDAMRRIIQEKEPAKPSTRFRTLPGPEVTTTAQRRRTDAAKLTHLLRGDLDWIVMKCLEKDRARRYATANGLAADLKRHLNNEPVVARPPSAAYKLQKAWRRHKLVFTAAALVVAALVVGITVSSWQAIEAGRARNAEREQRLAAQAERDKARAERHKAKAAQEAAESAQQAEKQARLRADAEKAEASKLLYMADMNLAQQAWEQNNIGLLEQHLEETQAFPDRGFEWYYWQREAHLALKTLRGHRQTVMSAAFSPDGQRIVTGSWDQTAMVWEAASGRELLTLKGHRAAIYSVAFSPDGQRIVTGSEDQTARLWEAASGRELLTLKGHRGGIYSVAFSPDGQRIATGSGDKTAKVWEAASGRELLTLKGHSGRVFSVAFSPDSQRIATSSDDWTAKVWEAASGRERLTLKGHTDRVYAVGFSPDGQRIVTGSDDQTAKIWETPSGRELLTLKGHTDRIRSVAFSPDGQRIVTGSADQTAKLWDADGGRELLTLKGHTDRIYSVAFSPDGQWIVTGSDDDTAKVWEWKALGGGQLLTLKGHSSGIDSAAFSPDGQRIVTGSEDQTAKVWEAGSGRELLTLKGHSGAIYAVAFSPDGQRIATGSYDKTAKLWETASGKQLLTLEGHSSWIGSVAFSSLDGQRIITGSGDFTARVWETATGKQLLTLEGRRDRIRAVAFSPDDRRMVTGSDDRTAKLWEAASGRELLTLKGHSSGINAVAFSPDGRRIVTGSGDYTAKVWDTASGRELLTLKGHGSGVSAVAFSPDGQRIVTSSDDGTAKLWEAASGRELLTLKGHSSGINAVAFSPDGRRIVTGSADRTAKVWEASTALEVAAWQEEERAAAQRLAARERQRTDEEERQRIVRNRDSIKQWLVLAPIALPTGQSGVEGLDIEQIEGEARLRPKAGEAKSIGAGELKWREVALPDCVIDFNAMLGHETPQSVAYAVCYIRSEAGQRGLQMLVGSDDEAKAYLNGKQIYKCPFPRSFIAEQDKVPDIALDAGLNVLVFKVVNETYHWKGSIRLTDSKGNPVKGIQATLDPEAKDHP